jgi:hypothetical protein
VTDYSNVPIRYVTGVEPAPPPPKSGVDLVAVAIFAVAAAIWALTFAVLYIGINYLNMIGAQWHWVGDVAHV